MSIFRHKAATLAKPVNLFLVCEEGAPLPDEWVNSLVRRHGATGSLGTKLVPAGSLPAAPDDAVAAAIGLYQAMVQAGATPSLGSGKDFEAGATPDGRRYAVLVCQEGA